jgi:hypothetical protein
MPSAFCSLSSDTGKALPRFFPEQRPLLSLNLSFRFLSLLFNQPSTFCSDYAVCCVHSQSVK